MSQRKTSAGKPDDTKVQVKQPRGRDASAMQSMRETRRQSDDKSEGNNQKRTKRRTIYPQPRLPSKTQVR